MRCTRATRACPRPRHLGHCCGPGRWAVSAERTGEEQPRTIWRAGTRSRVPPQCTCTPAPRVHACAECTHGTAREGSSGARQGNEAELTPRPLVWGALGPSGGALPSALRCGLLAQGFWPCCPQAPGGQAGLALSASLVQPPRRQWTWEGRRFYLRKALVAPGCVSWGACAVCT